MCVAPLVNDAEVRRFLPRTVAGGGVYDAENARTGPRFFMQFLCTYWQFRCDTVTMPTSRDRQKSPSFAEVFWPLQREPNTDKILTN